MRNRLLACMQFRWERISPAVFGSLFQSVMDAPARRKIGAHYTAEKNILKLIRSLFLDELREEFSALKKLKIGKQQRLEKFHAKLASLAFLDPACGCGNFLIITYRELRRLELELLKELTGQREFSFDEVNKLSRLNVHQFYGIEIEEFPARIAEVGLWLADHQANMELSHAFSQLFLRLPLRVAPHIHVANALQKDWREILQPEKCSYILGNPPFVGKHYQTEAQRNDLKHILGNFKNTGDIDYVTAWYFKAAEYMSEETPHSCSAIRAAFVSTNSITQGEQIPAFWGLFFGKYHMKISFAHRTFKWESDSKGKAHVHCVIIGFCLVPPPVKTIYDYAQNNDEAAIQKVDNISPYLTAGPDTFVTKRTRPLGDVPEIRCGNKPSDDGNFIFTDAGKREFLRIEPEARRYFRRYTGSEEFINGGMRWCLWLKGIEPDELRKLPEIMKRVEAVRQFRMKSSAAPTREAANRPAEFFYMNQPDGKYIAIPEVSSERRPYIPIDLLPSKIISSNKIYIIPSEDIYLFAVLTSAMHMAWVKQVGGRLESRYQYSGSMVYNTFPWPQKPTARQCAAIEAAAQAVLDARARRPASTLADLYDPISMPPDLHRAHEKLNRVVDRAYRSEPFKNDRARVEHLFHLHQTLTDPLLPTPAKKQKKV
ncbi:MAG: N-6 DNA methylase [Opitutaceae bacterium]|jgi:hypothetical protein|nr:N-6 DNA methylase [Opitutaceae bacterium]